MILLIDSNRGIHIPKVFAERCKATNGTFNLNLIFSNMAELEEDINTLLQGDLDHEEYWYAWESIISNANFELSGEKLYIEEIEGDVWLVSFYDQVANMIKYYDDKTLIGKRWKVKEILK
jgi:hypothetical protein